MYENINCDLLPLAQSGDKAAFDRMVSNNMGLVKSIAFRFRDRGVEYEDLIQIGSIGLIKAVKNFDSSVGTRFSTYAVPLIIGEIKKFLRDDGIIKVSRDLKRIGHEIWRYRNQVMKETGNEPSVSQLTEHFGVEEETVVRALEATSPLLSFTPADDEMSLENIVGTDNIHALAEHISLHQAIERLNAEDKKIIRLRYFRGLSQAETGKAVGMTQVMISRKEKRIIAFLKEELFG